MLLQVALNDGRRPEEHQALLVIPEQIAAEGERAMAAEAMEIHLHVCRADGIESLAPRDIVRTLSLARQVCPLTPIGLSTSAIIAPDPAQHFQLISQWILRRKLPFPHQLTLSARTTMSENPPHNV